MRHFAHWGVDPAVLRAYAEDYHADNPLNEFFPKFDVEEAYNISMVMDPDRWLQSRVYRELGQRYGWLDNLGLTLMKSPSRFATLSIVRHESVGFAGSRELEILRLLAPHLRKALTISDLIDIRELTARTFETSFDALAVPAIFLNRGCRIIHANRSARELLAARDPFSAEGNVLRPRAVDAQQRFAAAVTDTQGDAGESGNVVYLPLADGRPVFAHVLPTRLGAVRGRIEPNADAVVFMTPANASAELPFAPWASAFGLTASEMRVLELLVAGRSIVEAAGVLNVAETTARTHLARLMQKTSTNRQIDLVRLAMRLMSPLRGLAP
jgi:DNA-binding CsgD family transcriptional regulator